MAKVGKKFNFGDLAPEIPSQNTADDADAPPGSPAAAAKSVKSEPQEDADAAPSQPPAGAKKRKATTPKKQVKKEEKEDSSEGAPPPPPADDDSSEDDVAKAKKRAVAAEGGEGTASKSSGGGKHRKGWTAFNEKSGHKTENGRRRKDWSKPKKPKAAKGAEGEEESGEKKRRNPGRAALSEIKRMQKTTDLIIPDLTMVRIIKEAIQDVLEDPRFHNTKVQDGAFLQRGAAVALHHATEDYAVELFYYANRLAIHRGRQTIMPQDIREVCYLLNNARSTRLQ
jgi:histone H3/H4